MTKRMRKTMTQEGRMLVPVEVPDLSDVEKAISRAGWNKKIMKRGGVPIQGDIEYHPRLTAKEPIHKPVKEAYIFERKKGDVVLGIKERLPHNPFFGFSDNELLEKQFKTVDEAEKHFAKIVNLKQFQLDPINTPWKRKKKER